MVSTVPCPECGNEATVIDSFVLAGRNGPVEYLRLRCDGMLSLLVAADEIRRPATAAA